MTQTTYLTVSQLNRHIRALIEEDPGLRDCWVQGEVSNYSKAASGHVYFTLKDESARLGCVMWRSTVAWQTYMPQDGDAVLCHGYVSVYEPQGRYQFYVDEIRPAGRGLLHLEFEALKTRLAAEGLFDESKKRPLPLFPQRIGVVTSPQAAALRDICQVLARRYQLAEVILAPTLVQGEEAPAQIVAALQAIHQAGVDVIILARGGGSLEELWAFNDEQVARTIAASPVPVISGVGHQTDFTIADFVADVRAPTPSAAAELAVPDQMELLQTVQALRSQMVVTVQRQIDGKNQALAHQQQILARYSPQRLINGYRQQIDDLLQAGYRAMRYRLNLARERLNGQKTQLDLLNPAATLARGYAIVSHPDTGRPITSVQQVQPGDTVNVQIQDGSFDSTVRSLQPHSPLPAPSSTTESEK